MHKNTKHLKKMFKYANQFFYTGISSLYEYILFQLTIKIKTLFYDCFVLVVIFLEFLENFLKFNFFLIKCCKSTTN